MRRNLKGRSKRSSATQRSPLPAQRFGASGGIVWPLRGRRPSIPVEDWAPDTERGLAWGAEAAADPPDIVVLVRGLSNGSLWAAEFGGYGSGLFTGSSEPDWTDTPPITDGDFTWYPVAGTAIQAWSAGMTIDGPTFVAALDHVWVSYPGYTGNTGGSEPDWASVLPGDFIADGDTYWWPFPLAEETITLDPLYGNAQVVALPGLDAFTATDDDGLDVTTAITSDRGIRLDQDAASIFVTTDGSGECVRIIRGGFGEGTGEDQSLGGLLDLLEAGFAALRLASTDDSYSVRLRSRFGFPEIAGTPGLAISNLPTSAPDLTVLGLSGAPACALWWDSAGAMVKIEVLDTDGTTQLSGDLAAVF